MSEFNDEKHIKIPSEPPYWPLPRYHITDALWDSFTIEGVNKSIEALLKRGEHLRHPEVFTVRVSLNALVDTHRACFEEAIAVRERGGLEASGLVDDDTEQTFYDFHHWGYKGGAVTGNYTMTQTIKLHQPGIPFAERRAFLELWAERTNSSPVILRQWWERNWGCTEFVPPGEFNFCKSGIPTLTAWVLITCLHERTVQRVIVEPRAAPKSRIAKELAARRGGQPDTTPETVLYVPARIYGGNGEGTHASPHLHYRSPHWRKQPFGPRSAPTYRDVWIEGMFINATDCTEAEKAEVKIRARNFKLLGATR